MRRKMEYIFTICSIVLSLLVLTAGLIFTYLTGSDARMEELYHQSNDKTYKLLRELMENIGVEWILPGVIGIVFGGILMYFLKKRRKIIAMGWMSVAVAAVLSFISPFGSFPALFFMITGLVILVRKAAAGESNME